MILFVTTWSSGRPVNFLASAQPAAPVHVPASVATIPTAPEKPPDARFRSSRW